MSTVLFVHGAWVGPGSWDRVRKVLADHGVQSKALALPLNSLREDAALLAGELAGDTGGVILAGHSYGGSVITEAGEHPRVAHLVYVAALANDVGESAGDLTGRFPTTAVAPAIQVDADSRMTLTDAGFAECFAPDLDAQTAATMAREQHSTHTACFAEPATRASWRSRPSTFFVSAQDQVVHPDLQRWMARRAGSELHELAASHASPVSHAEPIARLLLALASGTTAPR